MNDKPALKVSAPAGTKDKDQAGASGVTPATKASDRSFTYLGSDGGSQKPHPAKPRQPNVMRHLG